MKLTKGSKKGMERNMTFKICRFSMVAMLAILLMASSIFAEEPSWIGAFFVKGKVGLKWQTAAGAVNYSVYRKTVGGEFQAITTTDKTQYFDNDVAPGATYVYKIAGVDAGGAETFSGEKSVSIPAGQAGEFKPPTWAGIRIEGDKIMLRWDKVPGAIAYNIYRSTTPGADYDVVGNATGNRHADRDGLEVGGIYYYVVTALNEEFEETEFSEEEGVKFGMSTAERDSLEAAANAINLEPLNMTLLFTITEAGDNGKMNQPAEVAINSQGRIYITDVLNNRINCYDAEGKYLFSFGESTTGEADDISPGAFAAALGIYIDNKDQIWVSDVVRGDIQVFEPDGKFIKVISPTMEDGMEQFKPNTLHVMDDGRIVCTDSKNHRFLILDNNGKIIKAVGGRGGEEGQFNYTDGITVTSDNIICVVDVMNGHIQEFDFDGNFIRRFGQLGQSAGCFGRPKSVTFGEDGRLWVTDGMGNTVQTFTVEGEVKSAFAGIEEQNIRLNSPRGVVVKGGRVYIVNRLAHELAVYKLER
jgi:sugar lactone lactonase YvrE